MKKVFFIQLVCIAHIGLSQSALYTAGDMQLHGNVKLGMHTDWINEGDFTTNSGLVGFYGDTPIQISGGIPINLYDIEVLVPNNMFLRNTINVANNVNFILGNVSSPLNNQLIYLNFEQEAFYNGDDTISKVTGYAAMRDKANFTFPVGDEDQIKPLILQSDHNNSLAICAYLSENPGNPSSILEAFDTEERVRDIGFVSDQEFWILQTDVPSTVTLTWNERSRLMDTLNRVEEVILVGWSKAVNSWVIIGNTAINGDLENGFLVSEKFVPNEYAAITFGSTPLPTDTFAVNNPTLGGYFVSPNGDGINDTLVIDNLEGTGANQVYIYNRFGQKVFEQANYTNEFRGLANTGSFILNQDIGLPEGVYYYTISLFDLGLNYQGFFFLDR